MSSQFRGADFPVRYGGEGFLIILPQTTTTGALRVSQKLQQSMSELEFIYPLEEIQITSSFGIANHKDHSRYINKKLEIPDIHWGRNQIHFYGD